MVPVSTFSCGHDVMFLPRPSSTADVVCTFATGIARAFPSFLLYMHVFQFPHSRCRPQASLSDNLKPFQPCRGGRLSQIYVGWPPVIGKDHRLIGIHFFSLARARKSLKKKDTAFITLAGAQKNTSTCIRQVMLPRSQSSFVLVGRTLRGTPSTPCRAPP